MFIKWLIFKHVIAHLEAADFKTQYDTLVRKVKSVVMLGSIETLCTTLRRGSVSHPSSITSPVMLVSAPHMLSLRMQSLPPVLWLAETSSAWTLYKKTRYFW
jgi:hypothetical protein